MNRDSVVIDYIIQLRTLKKRIAYLDAVWRNSLASANRTSQFNEEYDEGVVQLALTKARKEAEKLVYHLKFNLGTSKVVKGKKRLQAGLERQVANAIEKQYLLAASPERAQECSSSNIISVSALSKSQPMSALTFK